jgi:hypothetical protein
MPLPRIALAATLALSGPLFAGCGGPTPPPAPQCPNDLPGSCPSPAPSWSQTVQPVIQNRCQRCHSPTGTAKNRLLQSYSDVYAQRSSVLNRVYACTMPPGGEPQPTTAEREALLGWLVCGAPNN